MTRAGSAASPPAPPSGPASPGLHAAVAKAKRWPSVATRLIDDVDRRNRAPFRKNRVSSPVIANCVLPTISASGAAARCAVTAPPASGIDGKSSRGSVCMRELKFPAVTFTAPASGWEMRISASGNARTISKSFRAGRVSDPPFTTVAPHRLRRLTSRSVATRRISEAPSSASISTWPRMGIVVLRSTMP